MIDYLLPCLYLLLPLVVCALAVHWFEQITQRSLSTRFGWSSVLWTGWLGTPIHETSHVLMCSVFRHRVDEVAFFAPDRESGRLGYVRHSFHKGNWFEEMGNLFIGIAPLIGGSVVLLALLYLFYPDAATAAWESTSITTRQASQSSQQVLTEPLSAAVVAPSASSDDVRAEGVWQRLWIQTKAMFAELFSVADWKEPRWWIFLYLVLCVGSHMAPSETDYRGTQTGSLITATIFAGSIAALWIFQVDAKAFADAAAAVGAPLLSVMALATGLCGISTMLVFALTRLLPKKQRQAGGD